MDDKTLFYKLKERKKNDAITKLVIRNTELREFSRTKRKTKKKSKY